MKHLKTFESFAINEEEGIVDDIKGIYKSATTSKEQAHMEKLKKNINAWSKDPSFIEPTKEVMDKYKEDAKADKWQGLPGIKNHQLIYRSSKDVNWGKAGGHIFGGGAGN